MGWNTAAVSVFGVIVDQERAAMALAEDAAFRDVVTKIYALALDDNSWSAPLDLMAGLFGAVGASFEVVEKSTNRPVLIELSPNLSLAPSLDYVEHYGSISPRVRYNDGKPSGFISYDNMILSESEMDHDEFYADCMAPQGLRYFLAAQVFCSGSHQAVFSVQRSSRQGHVGGAEISMLERLLPHLQQAMALKFRMEAARSKGEVGLDGLERLNEGCLIVDPAGRVLHMNSAALGMVADEDGMKVTNGQLSFGSEAASHCYGNALDQSIQQDGDPGPVQSFPALRRSGNRPFLVTVRALPEQSRFARIAWPVAAIVFIRDPDRFARLDSRLLRQSFDLTAAELEVAAALDRGQTLRGIAEAQQVSITTIRSHLYTLMAKVKVHRQTELVRLLGQYRRPFT